MYLMTKAQNNATTETAVYDRKQQQQQQQLA